MTVAAKVPVLALDGPGGSGKGTVGQMLAQRLAVAAKLMAGARDKDAVAGGHVWLWRKWAGANAMVCEL